MYSHWKCFESFWKSGWLCIVPSRQQLLLACGLKRHSQWGLACEKALYKNLRFSLSNVQNISLEYWVNEGAYFLFNLEETAFNCRWFLFPHECTRGKMNSLLIWSEHCWIMLNHCDQELQEQQNWWLVRLVRLVRLVMDAVQLAS